MGLKFKLRIERGQQVNERERERATESEREREREAILNMRLLD